MHTALLFIYIALGAVSGSTAFGFSVLYYKKYRVLEIAFLFFSLQVICMSWWYWVATSILRAENDDGMLCALWAGTLFGTWGAWRILRPRKRKRS